jgi:kinesin family protein 1
VTTVIRAPRNPKVLKSGYLLVPSNDSTRWVKRFVELRRPYMHIYSATDGDEVAIVSLRNSRVDSQPGVLGLLQAGTIHDGAEEPHQNGSDFRPGHRRTSSGRVISTIWTGTGGGSPGHGSGLQRLSERLQSAVFAIYGTDNTWLFTARSEKDKNEWIFAIDQSYFSNGGSTNGSGTVSPRAGAYPPSDSGFGDY